MCRIAASVGEPRTLSELMFDPPHSLQRQSYAPGEMVRGHVNVDGTGVAWWTDDDPEPLRYITERPPWSDANLRPLSDRTHASTILAAVRSATPGVPFGPSNVQPFVWDEVAAVHNGWIGGWRGPIRRDLLDTLSDDALGRLDVMNDSLVLTLGAGARVHDGAPLDVALAETIRETVGLVEKHEVQASLNVALAVAGRVVAVRAAVGVESNSLYVDSAGGRLASEPLDDAEWVAVPPDHLVDLQPESVAVRPFMEVL